MCLIYIILVSEKAVQRRVAKRKVMRLTNGLFATVTDLLLFCLVKTLVNLGKTTVKPGYHLGAEEAELLVSKINYQTIKNSLNSLKRQGLVESAHRAFLSTKITQAGLNRISQKIPAYQTERVWDKMIYLVSYDIPRKYHAYRDRLRNLLIKSGAARIHDSLYITPYNPKGILKRFAEDYGYKGQILVSMLTKDSQIGEEKDIKKLLWDYYLMDEVNNSYRAFCNKYQKSASKNISKPQLIFDFLSLVTKDPQLPFELLLDDYAGDEAYLLYSRLLKNTHK